MLIARPQHSLSDRPRAAPLRCAQQTHRILVPTEATHLGGFPPLQAIPPVRLCLYDIRFGGRSQGWPACPGRIRGGSDNCGGSRVLRPPFADANWRPSIRLHIFPLPGVSLRPFPSCFAPTDAQREGACAGRHRPRVKTCMHRVRDVSRTRLTSLQR
jgi:hypothetical protein